ncbi:hypothetical protein WICPIJ_001072 [Wickerhamomyces pijperi]|uniref:Chromatin modification-related protein n=1 Tax=Wickerhamomyces pijperi TaxID=599730 RepID=A0A9P8QEH3_WICPI|nr:hypothetical protein WICPIJ_001072 [Wickerhamomyces pijperi]
MKKKMIQMMVLLLDLLSVPEKEEELGMILRANMNVVCWTAMRRFMDEFSMTSTGKITSMDTAATLDQYTQDVSNLPAELLHILAELGAKDATMYEAKKKLGSKDAMIHKFIRQNGSMTKYPKEGQLYPKIREEFEQLEQDQKEKMKLANTALLLTSKHLMRLEADMEKLKNEGLLVQDDNEEFDMDIDVFSSKPSSRMGSAGAPNINFANPDMTISNSNLTPDSFKKHTKKASSIKLNMHNPSASISRTIKRQKTDELKTPEPESTIKKVTSTGSRERTPQSGPGVTASTTTKDQDDGGKDDEELYCFCRGQSYGSMVGCDNEDCKYEWFHFSCVGITEQPVGSWFCRDCLEKKEASKKLEELKKQGDKKQKTKKKRER